MAVLIKNTADHGRKQRAVGERPIRYGQSGFFTGDGGPGDDQERFLQGFCSDVLPRLRERFGDSA